MWILKKKYDYWWKKYGLEKTDRATKTSLFDRNWATSLKPRRRSRPLRLVWWALVLTKMSCTQPVHSLFFVKEYMRQVLDSPRRVTSIFAWQVPVTRQLFNNINCPPLAISNLVSCQESSFHHQYLIFFVIQNQNQ
jgi:hypothetical protein